MKTAARQRGLTLVEVMTGVAIIAFVASSVLLARAKLASQAERARLRLQACELMDALLAEHVPAWTAAEETPPSAESGQVEADGGIWRWAMQRRSDGLEAPLQGDLLVVTLYSPRGNGQTPILTLDLPVARPPKKTDGENEDDPMEKQRQP